MDGVETLVIFLVIFMLLLTWIFACFGIVISKRRTCHTCCVAIYGVLIFFIVMLPLMIEGVGFTKLGHIEDSKIEDYCDDSMRELNRENKDFVTSFFVYSKKFDAMSSNLLDKYMCTQTCPCRDYGSNPSTKELYEN